MASPEVDAAGGPSESMGMAPEIEMLLTTARTVTNLDSTLQDIFTKHQDLLLNVLDRQIDLISSRSQAFEDAQVTIFDKVLLELWHEDQESPASITWFCREYLGYSQDLKAVDNTQTTQQRLGLSVAIMQGAERSKKVSAASEPHRRRHHHYRWDQYESPSKRYDTRNTEHYGSTRNDDYSSSRPTTPMETSQTIKAVVAKYPQIERLWTVYEKALADYLAVADEGTYTTRDAAKWLRDTAENGIHYLQAQPDPDSRLIGQLRSTHTMASRMAEKLTGGRKRKFDHQAEMEELRYRPARRRAVEDSVTARARASTGVEMGGSVRSGSRSESHRKELFPAKVAGYHGGSRYDTARGAERVSRDAPRGRGHSGIPYGYAPTRFVDTYIPNRRRD